MPDANVVEVVLRANAAQLISGLKDGAAATGSAASAMQTDVAALGNASRAAAPKLFELGGALKEYRNHVRQENRYTQFLAGQVANLGVASKGAAAEITGFVSAFAFGSWIGLAVEGVKTLATHFAHVYEETHRADELTKLYGADLKAMGEVGAKHVGDLKKQVQDTVLSMRELRFETLLRHQLEEPLKKEKDLKEQIAKVDEQIAEAATSSAVTEQGVVQQDVSLLEDRKAKLQEELRKTQAEMKGLRKGVAPLQVVDERALDLAESIEEAKRAADQVTTDNAINLGRIRTEQEEGEAREAAEFKKKLAEEVAEAQLRANEATIASEINKLRIYTQQDHAQQMAALSAEAIATKTKDVMKVAQPFEHAFRSAFRSIIDGSKSVSEALAQLGKDILLGIVDQLIHMAVEAIATAVATALIVKKTNVSKTMGNIAVAESGAAAALASIPIVGPGLAIAAAEGMKSFLIGDTGPLLSARGGMDRVPRDGTLAVLHEQETVLSKPFSDGLHDLIGGGGRGRGDIHLHVHTVYADAASLRRLPEDPHFLRGIREAMRNGRMP